MRKRLTMLIGAAMLAALPHAPMAAVGSPGIAHSHTGHLDVDLATIERTARRDYERRDRSGLQGAGSVVTYRAGARTTARADGATVRLFRTRSLGIEPTMGIAPDGTLFAQGQRRGVALESVVLRSSDRGASWEDVSPRVSSGDTWKHSYTQDPYLTVDTATGRVFTTDLLFPAPGQMLSYSDDRGETWTTTAFGAEQTDHQTMFAGPPAGLDTTSGYDNAVYNCAANLYATAVASTATTCLKSLDGGATWRVTGTPPYGVDPLAGPGTAGVPGACSGLTGHGFVGADGTVYLPRGWCEQPWLAVSRDGGLTWTRTQVADNGMAASDSGPPDEIPQPSHEAAVAADRRGNVYYAWVASDLRPYLAVSTDGGESWSKPIPVAPPDVTQTALPALAIAPQGPLGAIAVGYMGSTNAPGPPYRVAAADYEGATWSGYLTVTRNAFAARPQFHTATINEPADPLVIGKCGTLRCGAQYDFIDVQVGPDGTPWMVAVDGCAVTSCTPVGQLVVARIDGVRVR
jgi:hypothetical protein